MGKIKAKKESTCPTCGAVEMVDINCEGLESCGRCSILGANYVENHPDAFLPSNKQEQKPTFHIRNKREKKVSQSEQWKKRWGNYLNRGSGEVKKESKEGEQRKA